MSCQSASLSQCKYSDLFLIHQMLLDFLFHLSLWWVTNRLSIIE
nr:MAG TPA: hypothetical protein [Caudoviricetes sp.]